MKIKLHKSNKKISVIHSKDEKLNRIQQGTQDQLSEVTGVSNPTVLEISDFSFKIVAGQFVYIQDREITVNTPTREVLGVCERVHNNTAFVVVLGIAQIDPNLQKPDDFDNNVYFQVMSDNLIKLGGGSAVPTNVNNLTDANIAPNLTDAQKTSFRLKIGAMGVKLAELVSNLTDAEKTAIKNKLGISVDADTGIKVYFADSLQDLPSNPRVGDLLITNASFTQRRTNPDNTPRDYTFRDGEISVYKPVEFNFPAGFYSAISDDIAWKRNIPTLRTAAQTATLLGTLTGDGRLDYSALKNAPTIPTLRTGAETARLLETLTGTDQLNYTALKNRPTIPSTSNLDDTNINPNMSDAKKTNFRSYINARAANYKITGDDLSSSMTNAQKETFHERAGIDNTPPPFVASVIGDITPSATKVFRNGQTVFTDRNIVIPAGTIGRVNTSKNIDMSTVGDGDVELFFGSPSRILYKDFGTTTLKSGTITGNTVTFISNEDITLQSGKGEFGYRGCSYGSTHAIVTEDSDADLHVYYTASTKPAGATDNFFKTITTGLSGNHRAIVADPQQGIVWVLPQTGNSFIAFDFDSASAVSAKNVPLTHPGMRATNASFYKKMILPHSGLDQEVYPYDADTLKEPSDGRLRFAFRGSQDEFDQYATYSDQSMYSMIYNDFIAYGYDANSDWQEGFDTNRSVLERSNAGWISALESGGKITLGTSFPTVPAPQAGDVFVDTNTAIPKPWIFESGEWKPYAIDAKGTLLNSDINEEERNEIFKKLALENKILYSDNADNLEDNRTYLLEGTASQIPVSGEPWLIVDKGAMQLAQSYTDGDIYFRSQNPGYTGYGAVGSSGITTVLRSTRSEIGFDIVKRFTSSLLNNQGMQGEAGAIYGVSVVISSTETREYQIALTDGGKIFHRFVLSGSNNRIENETWIEDLPKEIPQTNDAATIASSNSKVHVINQGDRGDDVAKVTVNTYRLFQRTSDSNNIVTETLFWAGVDPNDQSIKVYKTARIKSLRFTFQPWSKHWGQVFPSSHPPADSSKLWWDFEDLSLKRHYTRSVIFGERNENFEWSVPSDLSTSVAMGKEETNRLIYLSQNTARTLRALNYQGTRNSSKDINVGLQDENAIITGIIHDTWNGRLLAINGSPIVSNKKAYAYNPVDRSYSSVDDIDLTDSLYNFYGGGFIKVVSGVAKLYLLSLFVDSNGVFTRQDITVRSLNQDTYGNKLTSETLSLGSLTGINKVRDISSNADTHIHLLNEDSDNVFSLKGISLAAVRDTSKDITLDTSFNTNVRSIENLEGFVITVYGGTNPQSVYYNDSTTINVWDNMISPRSIREDMLMSHIVNTRILMDDAVTNAKLADDAVATRNIQNGNVTNPKIGNEAVNHRTMATNAIENENILNETIGLEKLAVDGHPRSAIGITDDGQSLAFRTFPYLDKRTIEELPEIDSTDKEFFIPVLAGKEFTQGATVSGAATSVQGFHQALAIDRNGTIAEFWRTTNATGQGHIRLSSIRGGSHADHTVSSFNSSTNIHMQSDGDYWWMMEFSNNELKLHRLNSKAFYPLNSYVFSSALRNSTFGTNINNFRGFAFLNPNTLIDGHSFNEIVIAGPNSAWIFSFSTATGFGTNNHQIALSTLADITDCQGVCVAGRNHSHMYFVDSPSTEACKAISTIDNTRISGEDFTFNNAGTTRVALAGYRDFLLNSWTNNNLSTARVDSDLIPKKARLEGNNKVLRTNGSGSLIIGDIT